jgi:hypothetical protein
MNLRSHLATAYKSMLTGIASEMYVQQGPEKDRQGIPLTQRYQRLVARGAWLVITGVAAWLFIAAIPWHAQHLHVLCQTILCDSNQSPSQVAGELNEIGVTTGFFLTYSIVIESIFALAYLTIATLIFWRRPDDLMALLFAVFLITFVLSIIDISQLLEQSSAWLRWLSAGMGFLGELTFPLCFYLFPDGRFVPRWIGWLLPGWFLWGMSEYVFPANALRSSSWYPLVEGVAFALGLGTIVISQIYRYHFVSTAAQRQQTKWVVFGMVPALLGFFAAGFVGFVVPNLLLPALTHQPSGTLPVVLSIIANGSIYLVLLLIPISLAIALMRYRLWDIDVIINRALAGALLSVLLAIIYAGLIIGLGSMVGLVAPKIGQPVVIVVSTLAIAALFQPFRRRIQQLIDRSFYRGKYDAARTLEEFSDRLRNEVNLTQVREHLLSVVQETMQPVHLSLWLCTDKPTDNLHAEMLIKSKESIPVQ